MNFVPQQFADTKKNTRIQNYLEEWERTDQMRKYYKTKSKNVHLGTENQLQKYKMGNRLTKSSAAEIDLRLIAECNRNVSWQLWKDKN